MFKVFRRFAFIVTTIFFLKMKKDFKFNKNWYFMSQILTSNARLIHPLASIWHKLVGRFNMWVTPKTNRPSFCLILKLSHAPLVMVYSVCRCIYIYIYMSLKFLKWSSTNTDLSWFWSTMQSTFTFFPSFIGIFQSFSYCKYKLFINSFQFYLFYCKCWLSYFSPIEQSIYYTIWISICNKYKYIC